MKYMKRPSLKILRSVEIFSKLSLSHLHQLSEALTEATFEEGQVIVERVSTPQALPAMGDPSGWVVPECCHACHCCLVKLDRVSMKD